MSTATTFQAIRSYLTGSWSTTPLAWDNEQFAKPEPPAPFVLVQVTGDLLEQMSIGAESRTGNRWEETGQLLLTVIVPLGTGSVTARTHAEALANLFRGLTLDASGLEFLDISIGLGRAADDDGPWWSLPVSIDWRRG